MERLQKVLARAGVASRRSAEEIIRAGRVVVNGEPATIGQQVDPQHDTIVVDGQAIPSSYPHPIVLMVHKPSGVVSTVHDPQGRPTVVDLVQGRQGVHGRLYPVGRLDVDSEGLILLTNDGELAARLTHPRYRLTKEYHVLVDGRPGRDALWRLRQGIPLDGQLTAPAQVDPLPQSAGPDATWLRVIIQEGRKRQIRRMCAAVGHPVRFLRRVAIGPLRLGSLPRGHARPLTSAEIRKLRQAVGLDNATAT